MNESIKITVQKPGYYSISSFDGIIIEKGNCQKEAIIGENLGNGVFIISFCDVNGNFTSQKYLKKN
jgi:hypothetical protein